MKVEKVEENPRKKITAEDLYPYMARYARMYLEGRMDEAKIYRQQIIEPITGKGALPFAPTEKELKCPMLLAKIASCSMQVRDRMKRGEMPKTYKERGHRVPTAPAAICRATMGGKCPVRENWEYNHYPPEENWEYNPRRREFAPSASGRYGKTRFPERTGYYSYVKGHYRRFPADNPDFSDEENELLISIVRMALDDNIEELEDIKAAGGPIVELLEENEHLKSIIEKLIGTNPVARKFDMASSGRYGKARQEESTKEYGYVKGHYRRVPSPGYYSAEKERERRESVFMTSE